MGPNVTLTPKILDLISKSSRLFEEMRPLLGNGRENDEKISQLNYERISIDQELGSLLREVVEQN